MFLRCRNESSTSFLLSSCIHAQQSGRKRESLNGITTYHDRVVRLARGNAEVLEVGKTDILKKTRSLPKEEENRALRHGVHVSSL